ncbi:DUF3619 family protein [Variovorax sp. VNK109]|uniref:DUF3619 family protein n=1 Tax=Variovorax sp. VNK109 TaxID=3400919 RepID=UPI003C053342
MNDHLHQDRTAEGRYARRIASRLEAGSNELPYDISERLRAARVQAVAQRRRPALALAPAMQTSVQSSGPVLALGGGDAPGWWTRLASAVPIVALVAGLVAINMVQAEQRAAEVAEIDAALLTDDLPPAAYTDPGFVQFLQSGQATPE